MENVHICIQYQKLNEWAQQTRESSTKFLQVDRTTPLEFENVALFLWLDLPSTLIRHANAALFLRLDLPSTLIRHANGVFRESRI